MDNIVLGKLDESPAREADSDLDLQLPTHPYLTTSSGEITTLIKTNE